MINPLILIHASLGEIGIFAFLWVLVEILNPTENRLKRAKIVALVGLIAFIASWFVGGYYYLTDYGAVVKPLIKAGPTPWAHGVITETKEHVFLMLTPLAALVCGVLWQEKLETIKKPKNKKGLVILVGFIVLLGLSMASMGYLISSGARAALEFGV